MAQRGTARRFLFFLLRFLSLAYGGYDFFLHGVSEQETIRRDTKCWLSVPPRSCVYIATVSRQKLAANIDHGWLGRLEEACVFLSFFGFYLHRLSSWAQEDHVRMHHSFFLLVADRLTER